MGEYVANQFNKAIRAKAVHRRWIAALLCLSILAGLGTASLLTVRGKAATYKDKVLDCHYVPPSGPGYADFAAHIHNDDCYDGDKLVCPLTEIQAHYHDESCYTEAEVLVCGLEENDGHVHDENCYSAAEGEPVCGLEESDGHQHNENCYTSVRGDLICGLEEGEEHTHSDACYAWTEELSCGLEEGEGAHRHSEACGLTEPVLICGKEIGEGTHHHDESCYETRRVLSCGQQGLHVHADSCYNENGELICGQLHLEAHVHGGECFKIVERDEKDQLNKEKNDSELPLPEDNYFEDGMPESDPEADLEYAEIWDAMFAELVLSGSWADDLLQVAASQLGYRESTNNFLLGARREMKGYTRYGAWYGLPYGDWCAMFIAFCLNYADIPEAYMPRHCSCQSWVELLKEKNLFGGAVFVQPQPGDLIFYDFDHDDWADHVGLVFAVDGESGRLTTLEGNRNNNVSLYELGPEDSSIMGYGILPERPADYIPLRELPAAHFEESTETMTVTVDAPAGAFPAGTTMQVQDVIAEEVMDAVNGSVDAKVMSVQAVDISFYVQEGREIEPQLPVQVVMTPIVPVSEGSQTVVHVDAAGEGSVVEQAESSADGEVVFQTGAFSVYAIVYTVDFHYEVDGKHFELSIPGGGFVSMYELVKALNILEKDASGEEKEIQAFLDGIAEITSSKPELVQVCKVEEDTTVGEIKYTHSLWCEYSSELTQEQINEINSLPVKAGDWALVSLRPFLSVESLTVVLRDGETFTIRVTDGQIIKTVISDRGESYEITLTYGENAKIPEGAELRVREILPEDEEYHAYFQESLEKAGVSLPEEAADPAAGDAAIPSTVPDVDAEGELQLKKVVSDYARIFDIEIWADGRKIEPAAEVEVSIRLLDAPKEEKACPQVVHFAGDGPELMALEERTAGQQMADVQFITESFSVYSVVYTVDFSYEINGKVYDFSLQGEDSISLRELIETLHVFEKPAEGVEENAEGESTAQVDVTAAENGDEKPAADGNAELDAFMADIYAVKFSSPELLAVCRAEKDETLGELKTHAELVQGFDLTALQYDVDQRNAKAYKKGEWVLISLKPFDTQETLTIQLTTGESFSIQVTDAQIPARNADGSIQTIPNPGGTTINLFDYWVDDELRDAVGRAAWPGTTWSNQGDQKSYSSTGAELMGTGNNSGINEGHKLKFSPAYSGTVEQGDGSPTQDGNPNSLNGWTGHNDIRNGTPSQGIVADTLDGNGYPQLSYNPNLGTNGESLRYLFDPAYEHSGKASYANANNLLYVDGEGYYVFQSADYNAVFDGASDGGNFTLTDHTAAARPERGFWPFGQENFWSGMHMNTEFSQPVNGMVLNPNGDYKNMVFEFAGDDDAWVYLDGILIGDGGGIHNITRIRIDFSTGEVLIHDDDNDRDVGTPTTLKAIFEQAHNNGEISDEDWAQMRWNGNTFADGSYHTFDFFYLERGGGESNLFIRYNMVSTYDFTGHKSYENNPKDSLQRNQFQFEIVGLDGKYDKNGDPQDADAKAIMPIPVVSNPEAEPGTFENPQLVDDRENKRQIYTTGVTEDGNINFGQANISAEEMNAADNGNPSVYRYIIRETVPDDAVNENGVKYKDASPEEKAAGGFIFGETRYDNKVYYMTAMVSSWQDKNGQWQHGLSKRYYTDDTYTTQAEDVFVSFTNEYAPGKGDVDFLKLDGSGDPVPDAKFTLYEDEACTQIAKDLEGAEQKDKTPDPETGKVSFTNMAAETYYMKETAPDGYAANDTLYQVVIEDSRGSEKKSRILIHGDTTETPLTKIINVKEGELSVLKLWQDRNGNPIDGGSRTPRVKIQRRHWEEEAAPTYTVSFNLHIDDNWGITNVNVSKSAIVQDSAVVEWYDCWKPYSALDVRDAAGNPLPVSVYSIDTNNHSRRLIINNVESDVTISVNYAAEFMWLRNDDSHWQKTQNVTISSGDGAGSELKEDTAFNSAVDASHFATLSAPSWSKTWTIGDGKDFPAVDSKNNPYLYYVVEVDEQGNPLEVGQTLGDYKLVGYSANNGSGITDQGAITVTNEIDEVPADITIKKIDAIKKNALGGARFYLTKGKNTLEELTVQSLADGSPAIELDDEYCFTVPEEGVRILGLTAGDYKLVEREAPDGYLITTDGWEFTVTADGTLTGDEAVLDGLELTIPNQPGQELPEAGGIGTHAFTALGAALLVGAALGYAWLSRIRRKEPGQDRA